MVSSVVRKCVLHFDRHVLISAISITGFTRAILKSCSTQKRTDLSVTRKAIHNAV